MFGRIADVKEPPQPTVFAFWPTLTYFCDCDRQLYDRFNIVDISKAITTTVKPPSSKVNGICDLNLRKKVKTP